MEVVSTERNAWKFKGLVAIPQKHVKT